MDLEHIERSKDVVPNDKGVVKIGDIFFVNSKDLSSYVFYESEAEAYGYIGQGVEINKLNSSLKLAIKYIGDGVFEEMVTHQKILSPCDVLIYPEKYKPFKNTVMPREDLKGPRTHFYDNKRQSFIREIDYKISNDINDFLKNTEELKQLMVKYPITLSNSTVMYLPSDEEKKKYLQSTDDERRDAIMNKLELAKKDVADAIKVIDHQISLASDLTKEKLDMAYLENQLYDFQKENNEGGKTL